MWYTLPYANTFICTPAHGGRAGNRGDRAPVSVRLYRTPVPDPSRQCRGPADDRDCWQPPLHRSDRAQCHACLSSSRPRCAPAPLVAPAHHGNPLRCWGLRGPAGVAASESTDVWPAHQPVDARARRRGPLRPRPHAAAVSTETIRLALRRLRVSWKRAKHWMTSPDPAYLRKKTARPPDPAGDDPSHVGPGL